MSEFRPISTLDDLNRQEDDADIVCGYLDGRRGAPEPGSDKSRAYWHGWRNGRVDGGYDEIDAAQRQLAHEYHVSKTAN